MFCGCSGASPHSPRLRPHLSVPCEVGPLCISWPPLAAATVPWRRLPLAQAREAAADAVADADAAPLMQAPRAPCHTAAAPPRPPAAVVSSRPPARPPALSQGSRPTRTHPAYRRRRARPFAIAHCHRGRQLQARPHGELRLCLHTADGVATGYYTSCSGGSGGASSSASASAGAWERGASGGVRAAVGGGGGAGAGAGASSPSCASAAWGSRLSKQPRSLQAQRTLQHLGHPCCHPAIPTPSPLLGHPCCHPALPTPSPPLPWAPPAPCPGPSPLPPPPAWGTPCAVSWSILTPSPPRPGAPC